MNAPERIWLTEQELELIADYRYVFNEKPTGVEYIRADVVERLVLRAIDEAYESILGGEEE